MATDALKIGKLLKGPYRSGPTSSPTSVRLKKSKSQIPTSSSFSALRSAVQDKLITAKLKFFVSVSVTLFGDLSGRCPISAIFYFRTPSYIGNSDGEICKDTGT